MKALLAALALSGASPAFAQAAVEATFDGYSVAAMRDYWLVGRDIQNDYRFEHAHIDAADAVEDGRRVLAVDWANEEGAQRRSWLMAHCRGEAPVGGRLAGCRYRLVVSSLAEADEEAAFEPAAAAARLRAAGVSPAQFAALVQAVPLREGRPSRLPEQWAEARQVQQIIMAPLMAQFAERFSITTIDSATCPAMTGPLRQLNGITLPPSRIPGLSAEPPYRPSLPHSPIMTFEVLAGTTTIRWSEGAIRTPVGERISGALREIEELCGG